MTVADRFNQSAIGIAPVHHMIGGREVPSISGRTFDSIDPSSGRGHRRRSHSARRRTSIARCPLREGRSGTGARGPKMAPGERAADPAPAWRPDPRERRRDRRDRVARHRQAARPGDRRGPPRRPTSSPTSPGTPSCRTDARTRPTRATSSTPSASRTASSGAISPVELPVPARVLEDRAGARGRQQRRAQDGGADAALDRGARPASCSRRACPAGVFNVVHGDGPTTGAALVAHPRRAQADVHRLDRRSGQAILRVSRGAHQERPPRARRQDPEHHLRRRGPSTRRSPARCSPPSTTRARSARAASRLLVQRRRRATRSSSSSWSGPEGHQGGRSRRRRPRSSGRSISQEQLPARDRLHRGGPARRRAAGARWRAGARSSRCAGGYYVEPTIFVGRDAGHADRARRRSSGRCCRC